MDAILKTTFFALLATTLICASPVSKRAAALSPTDSSSGIEAAASTTAIDLPTSSSSVVDEEIVIHKHEDEDLVEETEDGEPEVVHRDIDEYIVEPGGQEVILVSETEDDLFDTAESGLVFRPRFQYSQVQRQRRYRTPSRRRYYYRRN